MTATDVARNFSAVLNRVAYFAVATLDAGDFSRVPGLRVLSLA